MEVWREISGSNGFYFVSNFGAVKNKNGLVRKSHITWDGYLQIRLTVGKKRTVKIHKLVWEAFNGPIPEGYEINHIDENKLNNSLDNLSLVTRGQNINWGTRNERVSKTLTNGKTSKPVLQYSKNGLLLNEFPSLGEVQREFGFSIGNISMCCNGSLKQAYGFVWKYKE